MRIPLRIAVRLSLTIVVLVPLLSSSAQAGAEGACCLYCDPCEIISEDECIERGGEYWGDGTVCEDCPEVAEVPDPGRCRVEPADQLNGLFLCPGSPENAQGSVIEVTVVGACGVYANANVVVTLSSSTNVACPDAILTGTTDNQGKVSLVLSGSGCTDDVPLTGLIKANGVTIRSYDNAKSPDADADGSVNLGDLVEFSNEFLDSAPAICHDYDNNEDTDLSDLILMSTPFVNGNHCP